MAGAGYKLFNTGDVLLASEVNTYLMQQTVMVFADSAARTTALSGVLAEGMISYLADTNATEVYNGSAWVSVSGTGDITAVTTGANSGLAGGATSGAADIKINFASKGQLAVGTGSGTTDFLNVGTNGYTIVADSGETTGLKWAAPAGGAEGWTILNGSSGTALTGATTITVSGISDKSQVLVLVADASSANSAAVISVRFNTDTASNYLGAGGIVYATANPDNLERQTAITSSTAGGTSIPIGRMGTSAAAVVSGAVKVTGAKSTSNAKGFVAVGAGNNIADARGYFHQGVYVGTSAISSISVVSSTGNFDAGTVWVFGSDN